MTKLDLDISKIRELSCKERKTLLERFAKLSEESGELAQELLIAHKSSGSLHKTKGEDGVLGEAVDVTLVALSIYFSAGGTAEELAVLVAQKCSKWERYQQ